MNLDQGVTQLRVRLRLRVGQRAHVLRQVWPLRLDGPVARAPKASSKQTITVWFSRRPCGNESRFQPGHRSARRALPPKSASATRPWKERCRWPVSRREAAGGHGG